MKKKKGVWALSYTGKLILGLVFTALALIMVREMGIAMNKGYDKQICKQSVVLNSKVRMPVAGTTQFEIGCPTRYITIGTDYTTTETEKGGEIKEKVICKGKRKGVSDTEESKECFKEHTNKVIANLLYDCWDQFGRGRLKVFSETSQDRNCVICSRIEFTEEAKEIINSVDNHELEFDYYLRNNTPSLHKISYHDFLMDELDATDPSLYYFEYYPEEVYAAVYRIKYSSKIKEIAGKAVNLAYCSGKWVFSFIGAEPCDESNWAEHQLAEGDLQVSTVNEFLPYNEVKNICDALK